MASSLSANDEAGHTTSSPDEEVFHPLMGGHPMHPFFPLMVSLVVGPQGQLPFWNGVYDTELVLVDRAASEDLKRKELFEWFGSSSAMALLVALSQLEVSCENKRVADVGCGNGHLVEWLAKAGFKEVTGIDYSRPAITLCERLRETRGLPLSGGGVSFVQDDLIKTDLPPASFDIIVDKGTLDSVAMASNRHVDVDEALLWEAAERLRVPANVEALLTDGPSSEPVMAVPVGGELHVKGGGGVEKAAEEEGKGIEEDVVSAYVRSLAHITEPGGWYLVLSSNHGADELMRVVGCVCEEEGELGEGGNDHERELVPLWTFYADMSFILNGGETGEGERRRRSKGKGEESDNFDGEGEGDDDDDFEGDEEEEGIVLLVFKRELSVARRSYSS